MFGKIKCRKCGKKSSKNYNFCPFCGIPLKDPAQMQREYGMLGQEDLSQDFNALPMMMGGGMLGKMLAGTMQMLEKELAKEMANNQNSNNKIQKGMPSNFQLYINGRKVNLNPETQMQMQAQTNQKNTRKKIQNEGIKKYFTKEKKEKFSALPQQEPTVEIKRLSDSIICEISTPGVKTLEDVSIVQLNNSIEIKAMSNDKAYSKTIKLGLPLLAAQLDKDKLILELQAQN